MATPCYGGNCTASFVSAALSIADTCRDAGVNFHVRLLANESLIPRARNKALHTFLKSDATHLLFFDADQGMAGQDIIDMLDLDLDVVGAPVPMKSIEWAAVREAALHHEPDIDLAGPRFAFNLIEGEDGMDVVNGCIEVAAVGTGCMLIKREVIERMIAEHPETMYVSDGKEDFGQPMHALFDTVIDHSKPLAPRYLSEDYTFCQRWRAMGGKVHLYLRPKVTHQGSYTFKGNVWRMFNPPPAHEWDDIPSLDDGNPQKRFHLDRYQWAAEHIYGLIVANAACGSNYGTPILAAGVPDRTVVGFDRSAEALAINQEKCYGHAIECDIEQQQYHGYDVLVSLETLEHLKEPIRWLKMLSGDIKEMVLSVPIIPTKHANEHHLHNFSDTEIVNVLDALGWRIVDRKYQDEFVKDAVLLVYAVRS